MAPGAMVAQTEIPGATCAAASGEDVCVLVADVSSAFPSYTAVMGAGASNATSIALGAATDGACCWRHDGLAAAVVLTDANAGADEPRHRVAFLARSPGTGAYFCLDTKAVDVALL